MAVLCLGKKVAVPKPVLEQQQVVTGKARKPASLTNQGRNLAVAAANSAITVSYWYAGKHINAEVLPTFFDSVRLASNPTSICTDLFGSGFC